MTNYAIGLIKVALIIFKIQQQFNLIINIMSNIYNRNNQLERLTDYHNMI